MNKKPKVQLSCDFIEFIQKDFRAWFLKPVFLSITSLEISCSSLLEFPVLPKKDSAKPGCYNDLLRVDPYLNYLNKIPQGTQRSQMGNALLTCFAEQSWAILKPCSDLATCWAPGYLQLTESVFFSLALQEHFQMCLCSQKAKQRRGRPRKKLVFPLLPALVCF